MKISAKVVWGTALLALLGYEVYTLASKEKGDTLSECVWAVLDTAAHIVPFACGIVCGHWFWPRKLK